MHAREFLININPMKRISIYTTPICGYCLRAKALLDKLSLDYQEIDLFLEPERRAEMVQKAFGRTSVPQIFFDEKHIGGSDELYALYRQGQLLRELEAE